jgi:hypothetical protein
MDAWGSLTTLIKKQEAVKQRKATIRKQLRKRKESFINVNPEGKLEFPELSRADMANLKDKIRKEYRKAHFKKGIVNALIFLSIALIFYVIFTYS